jgi:PAS domain S-box-containing protein
VGTYLLEDPALGGVVVTSRDVTERKEAEEALKENETFVRQVLRSLPNGSVNVFDRDLRYLFAEGRGLEEVGMSFETLVGRTIQEVFGEEGLGLVEGHYRKAFSGEEVRFELPMGGLAYEINAALLHTHEDGEVRTILAVARNVTERKRAEEKLREAEERYRTLVEAVPAMTYIQEIEEGASATIYVSPQVEEIVGYTLEECTSAPDLWAKILHPEDRERVLAEDRRTNETGEPFAMEYRQFARDGSVVWLRDEAALIRDENGKPLYWLGVQVDITKRRRAEEAHREAEERYRTLVEQIPAVTYIDRATDGPDEPIYTSPQIEDLLGYTPEEWLEGRLWPERIHPEDKERILATDERFEAGCEPFREEYRLVARDESVVWVREDAVLVRDEKGEPLYFQGVLLDITKRKEAEAALRESEARLHVPADSAFEGILITDEGVILEVNRALTDMFDYEASDVLGRSTMEFVAPEYRDLVQKKIASSSEEPYEALGGKERRHTPGP